MWLPSSCNLKSCIYSKVDCTISFWFAVLNTLLCLHIEARSKMMHRLSFLQTSQLWLIFRMRDSQQASNPRSPWNTVGKTTGLVESRICPHTIPKPVSAELNKPGLCFCTSLVKMSWLSCFSGLSRLAWTRQTLSLSIRKKTLEMSWKSSSLGRDLLRPGTACGKSSGVTGLHLRMYSKNCRSGVSVWSQEKLSRSKCKTLSNS